MTATERLLEFVCDSDSPSMLRAAPFRIDAWLVGTSGHFVVAIESDETAPSLAAVAIESRGAIELIPKLIAEARFGDARTVQRAALTEWAGTPWEDCDCKGLPHTSYCAECDEPHECICPRCHGEVRLYRLHGGVAIGVDVNRASVAAILRALPESETIELRAYEAGTLGQRLMFSAPGGVAALMGLRPQDGNGRPVFPETST